MYSPTQTQRLNKIISLQFPYSLASSVPGKNSGRGQVYLFDLHGFLIKFISLPRGEFTVVVTIFDNSMTKKGALV
jgi:hypothetical protein